MKLLVRILVLVLFGIVVRALPAIPQDLPQFKPEELDQLVAPIALHPDSLLAQILMASTYPLEVVQADRFVKDNAQLKGDQLSEELKKYSWDDSVKSLVFFPPVLTMMSEQLDWLQKLGDAFLAQQQDVLAAVAFPAEYGVSGVMTFIVNHDGLVYQKDLGSRTQALALGMRTFNPDGTWTKVDVPEITAPDD